MKHLVMMIILAPISVFAYQPMDVQEAHVPAAWKEAMKQGEEIIDFTDYGKKIRIAGSRGKFVNIKITKEQFERQWTILERHTWYMFDSTGKLVSTWDLRKWRRQEGDLRKPQRKVEYTTMLDGSYAVKKWNYRQIKMRIETVYPKSVEGDYVWIGLFSYYGAILKKVPLRNGRFKVLVKKEY